MRVRRPRRARKGPERQRVRVALRKVIRGEEQVVPAHVELAERRVEVEAPVLREVDGCHERGGGVRELRAVEEENGAEGLLGGGGGGGGSRWDERDERLEMKRAGVVLVAGGGVVREEGEGA